MTESRKPFMSVRQMVTMGLLAAMGIVLVAFIEIPIFPAAPYLKYDPADLPILIGAMIYGPIPGLLLTVVVSFAQAFVVRGSDGLVGFLMHVTATGAMSIVVGIIYRRGSKSIVRLALALVAGVITMTAVMVGMNLLVTPIYTGVSVDKVKQMLLPIIIPFNLLKAGINSVLAGIVAGILERRKLLPSEEN